MWKKLPLVAGLTVLLTAACGGGGSGSGVASLEAGSSTGDSTTSTSTVDQEQAMLDFAACMREHGIDMADPTVDENGGLRLQVGRAPGSDNSGSEASSADRATVDAARQACSQYLQGVVQQFDNVDQSAMQDQMLEYAACMRENGVDMPDPDFSGEPSEESTSGSDAPGGRVRIFGGFGEMDFDPSDPTFQAANEACQGIFGGQGGPMFGPGGPPSDGGTGPADEGTAPAGTTGSSEAGSSALPSGGDQ